jgi:hypothetical protein
MKKTLAGLGAMAAIIVVAVLIGTLITTKYAVAGEIARDGRFIAYNNGTVLDTRTNLMWAAKDNGSDINWADAKSYCKSYRGGGYKNWRMPTQDELVGLYDMDNARTNTNAYRSACGINVYLTELIRPTCNLAWSSETRGSDSAYFNLSDGHRDHVAPASSKLRVLPVRSVK